MTPIFYRIAGGGGTISTRFAAGSQNGGGNCSDSQKDNLTGLEWAKNTNDPAQGFTNLQIDNYYWSSTSYNTSDAWIILFGNGGRINTTKNDPVYVWPVRGGK